MRASASVCFGAALSLLACPALAAERLWATPADKAAKEAANRAAFAAASTKLPYLAEPAPLRAPARVHSFVGLRNRFAAPSNVSGAVSPTRYIQMVIQRFEIVDRSNIALLARGSMSELAGVQGSGSTYQQVIWDSQTQRFYFAPTFFEQVVIGFSKTASPSRASDFCSYSIPYGGEIIARNITLGDTVNFIIVGLNVIDITGFFRSDVIAARKPPAGTTCPASLSRTIKTDLRDANGEKAYAPVAANGIDASGTGYVLARPLNLPADRLWLYAATRDPGTGNPIFGPARAVPVASYAVPPDATQGGRTELLDTLDARVTQAVLARNPARGNAFSLWTQHTVANGNVSAVRWYELNPASKPPAIRRTGTITAPNVFTYNAAISPDRRCDGVTAEFGDSFVVVYNRSSAAFGYLPAIRARSSRNGRPLSAIHVKSGVDPYQSYCSGPGSTCRWGEQSSAAPDPSPSSVGAGVVWITSQYSGPYEGSDESAHWGTWTAAYRP
jgi:hypothetical protein